MKKRISAPSHSLSSNQDSGDSAAPDTVENTVTDTVKRGYVVASDTVTDTVKSPLEIARLFDADIRISRTKANKGHRTDVFLNPEELQMLKEIKKTENTTGQAVLRVALIHLYRSYYSNAP